MANETTVIITPFQETIIQVTPFENFIVVVPDEGDGLGFDYEMDFIVS